MDASFARPDPRVWIVVPCYDEERRLDTAAFEDYLRSHPDTGFIFVNDGSHDGTLSVLSGIRDHFPARAQVIDQQPNQGKAEAVRIGMLQALDGGATYAGYFDADLATPLEAVDDFLAVLEKRDEIEFILGSRVKLMGRDIRRKATRHYLGRVFATAVSLALDLPVYDTQCGAKVIRANGTTASLFETPFRSRWIFDVELIARYLRLPVAPGEPPRRDRLYELVLPAWHDRPGSKLAWYDFARAMVELGYIWRERLAYRAGATTAAAGVVRES